MGGTIEEANEEANEWGESATENTFEQEAYM